MVEKAERKKQLKAKRRAAGLCVECGAPSYPYSRCEVHRENHAYGKRKLREKYKKSGRCITCGRKLDKDIDGDNVTCSICIEDRVLRANMADIGI
ncbi:MAG: hypothetical protein UZ01_02521 [Candidatus Brocadia sinica]|nr:MAG: hypothetical protein UZ01_02521 [Candidatus Brocadia sinica]NUO10387.1 hypothetical protein [Candidatus Brocadia sp.]